MNREISNAELSKVLGVDSPLDITGTITVLSEEPNLPFVFLFDEKHKDEICLKNNLLNAVQLLENTNVNIIGVESHSGGKQWDQYYKVYLDDEDFDERDDNVITNEWPNFAIELRENYANCIYGVECKGMFEKMYCNLVVNDNEILDHPLNKERSKHFIKTLFELRRLYEKSGNLILNCGRDHNTHIVEMIRDNSITEITGYQANYIRFNAFN